MLDYFLDNESIALESMDAEWNKAIDIYFIYLSHAIDPSVFVSGLGIVLG